MSNLSLQNYRSLTNGGDFNINLTQEEACIALKVHDYGVERLSEDEKQVLYSLIDKLKEQIWP